MDFAEETFLLLVVPPVNVFGRETEVSDDIVSLLYAWLVALEELESSLLFLAHEMMVRLKPEIRIMFKIFFILSSKANVQEIADSILYNRLL